jgi:hypothetical protein
MRTDNNSGGLKNVPIPGRGGTTCVLFVLLMNIGILFIGKNQWLMESFGFYCPRNTQKNEKAKIFFPCIPCVPWAVLLVRF